MGCELKALRDFNVMMIQYKIQYKTKLIKQMDLTKYKTEPTQTKQDWIDITSN